MAPEQIRPDAARAPLRVASLFTGIGGFDLAFESRGAEVVFQCEADRYCRSVLGRHWPGVPLAPDIRALDAKDVPDADVWTAGFPCQDVSLARGGHGRPGFKGARSSLFFRLMDLVRERRPPVLLLENVVGLLSSHGGGDFAAVLRELAAAGYAASWRVLNARHFGTPQSRSRVFVAAWPGDHRRALASLFEDAATARPPAERLGFVTPAVHPTGAVVPEVAYCVAATSGRHTGNDWSRTYVSYADRVRRPTPEESERLQGFPAGWSLPVEGYPRPARGHDAERYRAVGNAVAVPVAAWIASRVARLAAEGPPAPTGLPFAGDVAGAAPEFRRGLALSSLEGILARAVVDGPVRRWKTGGCALGDAVAEAAAPNFPARRVPSSFVDALDAEMPDGRYFLSANAAAGILRRADAAGRDLFPPMREALARMAAVVPCIGTAQANASGQENAP